MEESHDKESSNKYPGGWIYSHRKGAEWRVACWGGAVLSVGDFLCAVSRSCAHGRTGTVTRWRLKSKSVGTLVLCIEETSLPITQPHTAYLAVGKRTSGVADPAVMSGCRCFTSVSRAMLMSGRDARHNIYSLTASFSFKTNTFFYILYTRSYVYCIRLTRTCNSTCMLLLFCWFWLLL